MATDYSSSNPFRKPPPSTTTTSTLTESSSTLPSNIALQRTQSQSLQTSLQSDIPKKIPKKVRVQSPPPPSPSIPDSASTIDEGAYPTFAIPPTPFSKAESDQYNGTLQNGYRDEAFDFRKQVQAPANPFQKTLETMEHPEREGPAVLPSSITIPVRASMDVDAFKRLLMTGNAGLGIASPTSLQAPVHHGSGDGGSSTETSSLSRQSIFEPVQEAFSESPRTSHELSDLENERRGAEVSTASRKKPPPPSSRHHGKLINIELRDDSPSLPITSPATPSSISSNQYFSSSHTDLNKPLPPAPSRASHESDRESIFDRESAGKTPEPSSPSASLRRKVPPAPPLGRRHSQQVSNSKFTVRNDAGRLSPKVEEDSSSITSTIESGRSRSDSGRIPPPPPPTRRPASLRELSHQGQLTSPSSTSLPPLPAARSSSRSTSTSRRPLSIASMDNASPVPSSNVTNKKGSTLPPPPPPHRHGHSIESDSRRTSAEHGRRSIEGSVRRGSDASSIIPREVVASPDPIRGNDGGSDILAEMSKLQQEIDALRSRSKAESVP